MSRFPTEQQQRSMAKVIQACASTSAASSVVATTGDGGSVVLPSAFQQQQPDAAPTSSNNNNNNSSTPTELATLPSSSSSATATAASITAALEARNRRAKAALEFTSKEDVRRMRFLALLCGRGAPALVRAPLASPVPMAAVGAAGGKGDFFRRMRERSGSVGGMGIMLEHSNAADTAIDADADAMDFTGKGGGKNSNIDNTSSNATLVDTSNSKSSPGKGGDTTIVTTHTTSAASSSNSNSERIGQDHHSIHNHHHHHQKSMNYQPTTPSNLSRRILHKCGVGYLDESLPLLLSAMSDRFLATILVQAMACRDRRLEGYRAVVKERHRRSKHRKRVLKERRRRNKRLDAEMSKRRKLAEEAIREAKDLKPVSSSSKGGGNHNNNNNNNKGGGASFTPVIDSGVAEKDPIFRLSEKDIEAIKEYKKQTMDVDAEEEYYNSFNNGGMGDDITEGGNCGKDSSIDDDHDDDEYDGFSDEDDDEEDELDDDELDRMVEDVAQYDLKLRDLVRPLSAWGFDITSKLGLLGKSSVNGVNSEDDESEDDSNADGDHANAVDGGGRVGGGAFDDEEEEDIDEGINSEDDDATTGDEGGGARGRGGGTKRKKPASSASPPKKKAKTKKTAICAGTGAIAGSKQAANSGDGSYTIKKTTVRKKIPLA